MGRLTYARKFALIGLVLLVPAGVALRAYWDQQGVQIAFSAKERVGDAYVGPARDLVTHVAEARGLAVRAAAGDSGAASDLPGKLREVDASVAAVGRADASMGEELETTKLWNELKADIATAEAAKPRSPQAAFDAWAPAASGATGLIVQVSNGSNLILDPDLDTFYLMDALITKLPAIVDNAGQASDLQVIVAHEGTIAPLRLRLRSWPRPRRSCRGWWVRSASEFYRHTAARVGLNGWAGEGGVAVGLASGLAVPLDTPFGLARPQARRPSPRAGLERSTPHRILGVLT